MEHKVGSVFTYKSKEDSLVVKLRVVKVRWSPYHCFGCFFWDKLYPCDGKKAFGDCRCSHRADKTDVIFKEVKE